MDQNPRASDKPQTHAEQEESQPGTEQRARELAALYETSLAINAQQDLPTLLRAIVERAAGLLGARMGGLYLLRPDGESLELVVSHDLPGDYTGAILHFGEGLSGQVAQTGQPMMVEDYHNWAGKASIYTDSPFRRVLGVPLKLGAQVIGVINITDDRMTGPFSPDEIRLASLFAEQAAISIQRARLIEAARRQAQELSLLDQVRTALARELELPMLLKAVVEAIAQAFHYQLVGIYLVEGDQLVLQHEVGYKQILATIPLSQGVMSRSVRTRQPILVKDVRTDTDFLAAVVGAVSEIAVPLFAAGQVVGVLNVESTQLPLGEADLKLLITLGGHIDIAFERAQLYERVRQSEERFRTSVETLLDGFAILSTVRDGAGRIIDFRYEYINEAGSRTNARPLADHFGRGLQEVLPQIQEIGLLDEFIRVVTTGEPLIKEVLMYEDLPGSRRQLFRAYDVRAVRLGDGFAVTWRDVTQRKRIEGAEREQRSLAEALRDTAAALTSTMRLDEVLDRILSNASRVLPHENATIMLVEGGAARIVRERGYTARGLAEFVAALRLPVGGIPDLRRMAESGKPVIIPDTYTDPDWIQFPETAWIRSYAGTPILSKGQAIGFLNLDASVPGYFTEEQGDRLQAFADQAAIALENARLFEEAQSYARRMAILNDIARVAISAPDLRHMFQTLADRLRELYGAEGVTMTMWDESQQLAIPMAASGPLQEFYPSIRGEPGIRSITSAVLEAGHVLAIEDPLHLPDIDPQFGARIPARAMLAIPLIADRRKQGAALINFPAGHPFSEGEVRLGEQVAGQLALTIAKVQAFERMQQLAITDELTGLYNRRGLFELGRREVERSHRFGHPLSAALLDIDHFKTVNDRFGHPVGDQVLQRLVRRCRENIRDVDIFGRYGGEEFVLLFPESDVRAGLAAAERLRLVAHQEPFQTSQGPVEITVSLGIVGLEGVHMDLLTLIARADEALYRAKNSGRNCVVAL